MRGRHVYCIGIGGCGVSALARMLRSGGAEVSGSDRDASPVVGELRADGYKVFLNQQAGRLPEVCDLVVCSAAVGPDHPEVLEAQRRGIEVLSYAETLGRCMAASTGVALAGTHGKSTTTGMLGALLVDAGLDPSVIVGAGCRQLAEGALGGLGRPEGSRLGASEIPRGALAGRSGLLLAEACEFNRSFHNLHPTIASISAVEADHLDIYGSLDAVVQAFAEFAQLIPPAEQGGLLLIAEQGAHRREITAGLTCEVQTIGWNPASDWVVAFDQATRTVQLAGGRERLTWQMRIPGAHNAMNAATAAALALRLGAEPAVVEKSLGAFEGVERRTQFLGVRRGVRVWDDYGHHPTEVDATLDALRTFEGLGTERTEGKLVCVFQPHQHSRTRFLLDEFASAFEHADVVIVPTIYFVRDTEAEKQKVSSADLVDRLRARGQRAMHLHPFEAIVEQLENVCNEGDTLVVMGAGPVWKVAHDFLRGGPAEDTPEACAP